MASGAPQDVATVTAEQTGLVARTMTPVRQLMCGLHGHDALLHFGKGRLSLQCTSCGYETPGWDLKAAVARTRDVAPRARVLRLPLFRERRAA